MICSLLHFSYKQPKLFMEISKQNIIHLPHARFVWTRGSVNQRMKSRPTKMTFSSKEFKFFEKGECL